MRVVFSLLFIILADDKTELESLTKDLKHKDAKVRLKAIATIEAKGEAVLARELCDAILDKDPKVSKAALVAVEKINAPVYKALCTLILSKQDEEQLRGMNELGLLKEQAAPAIGVMIAKEKAMRAQALTRNPNERGISPFILRDHTMNWLEAIAPEDEAVVKFYRDAVNTENRHGAVGHLLRWAGEKEDRRKTVYPYIKAAVTQKPNQSTADYIKWAGEYGALSKDLLPTLKELKLNESQSIREAASNAILRIEDALKPN